MEVSTILDQHKMDRNLSYHLNDLFSGNRSDAASDLESRAPNSPKSGQIVYKKKLHLLVGYAVLTANQCSYSIR